MSLRTVSTGASPPTIALLLLFFFSIPRSPRSTLFPYTTLFRSGLTAVEETLDLRRARPRPNRVVGQHQGQVLAYNPVRDRKSTRLNSSHRCISYAVFCLKKKTP